MPVSRCLLSQIILVIKQKVVNTIAKLVKEGKINPEQINKAYQYIVQVKERAYK